MAMSILTDRFFLLNRFNPGLFLFDINEDAFALSRYFELNGHFFQFLGSVRAF